MSEKHFVYFIIQRSMGSKVLNLKIGHTKNIKRRFYSYSNIHHDAIILHSIECNSKKDACLLERSYISKIKSICLRGSIYIDTREWFILDEKITNLLKSWGMNYEYNIQNYSIKVV